MEDILEFQFFYLSKVSAAQICIFNEQISSFYYDERKVVKKKVCII